jgi:predicted transcriptional regulator
LRGRPERSLINRRIKQDIGHTSLTMELASWVRESQQNGREVAHALDVKPSVVSNIRAGRTFRPAAASSVFALGLVGQS